MFNCCILTIVQINKGASAGSLPLGKEDRRSWDADRVPTNNNWNTLHYLHLPNQKQLVFQTSSTSNSQRLQFHRCVPTINPNISANLDSLFSDIFKTVQWTVQDYATSSLRHPPLRTLESCTMCENDGETFWVVFFCQRIRLLNCVLQGSALPSIRIALIARSIVRCGGVNTLAPRWQHPLSGMIHRSSSNLKPNPIEHSRA